MSNKTLNGSKIEESECSTKTQLNLRQKFDKKCKKATILISHEPQKRGDDDD